MGKEINCKVICDICEKEAKFAFNVEGVPHLWGYAHLEVDGLKSSKFIICPSCRQDAYKPGIFAKIYRTIFTKEKK